MNRILRILFILILLLNLPAKGILFAANVMTLEEYNFWISSDGQDLQEPLIQGCSPEPGAEDVARSANIKIGIFDTQSAIDSTSIDVEVNGAVIISNGSVMTYQDVDGVTQDYEVEIIEKTDNEYVLMYDPADDFNYEQTVTVSVSAADIEGNSLEQSCYSFKVQEFLISSISSFADSDPVEIVTNLATTDTGFLQDNSVIIASSEGKNVFVAWEQRSSLGYWDIYCARSTDYGQTFESPVKVNPDASGAEQRFPSIALDSDNNVYVSWQQKQAAGDWDIYIAKMDSDEDEFSQSYLIYDDPDGTDQMFPSIAVGPALRTDRYFWTEEPATVYAVWTEDDGDVSDLHYTRSTSSYSDEWYVFADKDVCINADRYPQQSLDPVIRLDDSSRVFVSWRGENEDGTSSIYFDFADKKIRDGEEIFQSDIVVCNGTGGACAPELEVSFDGNSIYLLFKELSGDQSYLKFCYYRYSDGSYYLNTESLVSSGSLSDDALGGYDMCVDLSSEVTVVWSQDDISGRNINMAEAEYDGYEFLQFASIITSGCQENPCLAVGDLGGHYYLGWTDDISGSNGFYFCRNTYIATDDVTSQKIDNNTGGMITVTDGDICGTSIEIPADAIDTPVTVTIAESVGAPSPGSGITRYGPVVDFGPGQTLFNVPVTITLPYDNDDCSDEEALEIFYYNISTREWELVSGGQVDTSGRTVSVGIEHFSIYMVADANQSVLENSSPDAVSSSGGGGGGGGGCFIATAAFGTSMDKDVYILRQFRDRYLLNNKIGTRFVQLYYKYSPPMADKIRENDNERALIRGCLKPLVWLSRCICK